MLDGGRYYDISGADIDVAGDAVSLQASGSSKPLEHVRVTDSRWVQCCSKGCARTWAASRQRQACRAVPPLECVLRRLHSRSSAVLVGAVATSDIRLATFTRLGIADSVRGLAVQLR